MLQFSSFSANILIYKFQISCAANEEFNWEMTFMMPLNVIMGTAQIEAWLRMQ